MKQAVKMLLVALFLFTYINFIERFIWGYLPIGSSFTVLTGSIVVLVISLILSVITVEKIIEIIRS